MTATTREKWALAPYQSAVERLTATKLTSTAEEYCDRLLQNLISVNNAAESMHQEGTQTNSLVQNRTKIFLVTQVYYL